MQEPGQKLRRRRERLRLRYRDVEEASQQIANQHGNHHFVVGLSRLADIENKGTLPSLYRLYSLCAIYGLDFSSTLNWYGIDLRNLAADSARVPLTETHPVGFQCPERAEVELPVGLSEGFDLRRTSYLTAQIERWGKLPLVLLGCVDSKRQQYGYIGTDDWSMYPVIPPGSFLQIDGSKRRIAHDGWANEHERPIYFVDHRDGYRCGWCTETGGVLIVQPHFTSHAEPGVFRYPEGVEVLGQVVGVAMRLDLGKRRRTRFQADLK